MDWKRFDRARRTVGPEELDLIESFAKGRINRRDFVRRGTVIGLSVPFLGAVIAACGGDDDAASDETDAPAGGDTTPGSAPTSTGGTPGGIIRVASQKPAGPLDPIGMQDLGSYGIVAQCFEFLCHARRQRQSPASRPASPRSWESNDDGSVWTFNLRQGVKWHDGTDFTSADVAATIDRLAGRQQRRTERCHRAPARSTPPTPPWPCSRCSPPNGNFPYLVSVYNAQSVITPVAYTTGTTLDASPNGTGPWKLNSFDAATGAEFERNADCWGGAPALRRQVWSFFDDEGAMVTAASAGEVDTLVQFQVVGGDAAVQQPELHRHQLPGCHPPPDLDALRHRTVRRQAVRQALGMSIDRQALDRHAVQGQGRHRQRPRDRPDVPVLRRVGAAARARHRRREGTARRGRVPRRPDRPCCTSASCRRSRSSRS